MKKFKKFYSYWVEPFVVMGMYIVVRLYKALTGCVRGLVDDLCHLPTRAYAWYHEVEYEKKQGAMRDLTLEYALGRIDVNEYQKLKKEIWK